QQIVIQLRAPATEDREAQVVAHQRTDAQPAPGEAPNLATGGEVLVLAAHAKEMALVVMPYLARGKHEQQPVEVPRAVLRDDASHDGRTECAARPSQPLDGSAAGWLPEPRHLHAEAGGEGFGKHDQISASGERRE